MSTEKQIEHKRAAPRAANQLKVTTHKKGQPGELHKVVIAPPAGIDQQIVKVLYGKTKPAYHPIMALRKGLPLGTLGHVSDSLKMTEDELLPIIGLSTRTVQRRRKAHKPLDLIESDRLYRLAKIQARATEVFEDKDTAVDWLKSDNRALGDKPLNLLDTEAGTDLVERVLTRIEHGVYS